MNLALDTVTEQERICKLHLTSEREYYRTSDRVLIIPEIYRDNAYHGWIP